MVGIYKITNIINNQVYIGQSINIEMRWQQHIYEGTHQRKNSKLYAAMNKYGIQNFMFEVLEECPLEQSYLDIREQYWIEYYNSYNNGYNMTIGGQGEGSWTYDPKIIRLLWDDGCSVAEIKNMLGCCYTTIRKSLKGYRDYNSNLSHSRGIIQSIKSRKDNQTLTLTENQSIFFASNIIIHQYSLEGEYIQSFPSISAAARAVNANSPGCETNIRHAIDHTDNQKSAYGYQWSLIKVDKMPIIAMPHSKIVECITTHEKFLSAKLAAAAYNIKSTSNIIECCNGKRKSAGKHPQTHEKLIWRYSDNGPLD